jgi:hypothetical protein
LPRETILTDPAPALGLAAGTLDGMSHASRPSVAEALIALAAIAAIVGVFLPWESLGVSIPVEIRGIETLPGQTVLALSVVALAVTAARALTGRRRQLALATNAALALCVFALAAVNVSTVSAFGILVVLAAGAAGTIVGWAAALRRAFRSA